MYKSLRTGLLLIFFTSAYYLCALDETNENNETNKNIVPFKESLAINFFGTYNIISFNQEESAYRAEQPWALGFGVRYKNIALSLSLPSFYAFESNIFDSFDIQINSYYDVMYYETFFKRYQKFYVEEDEDNSIDMSLFSTGISAGWIQNNKQHSLRAVYDLDGRQLRSSGSFLLGMGVFYTSIYTDNDNIKHYAHQQRFVYFGPNLGYSYTFIFSRNIFLNINYLVGLNAGINTNTRQWSFIPQLIPKISFGHHNNSWSVNLIAGTNFQVFFWNENGSDNFLASTITLAFSKRLR
jgi:hypothetical protein